jgi:hypothetical protein
MRFSSDHQMIWPVQSHKGKKSVDGCCEDSYTESLCCDSAFARKKKFYIFKFPKRFSEIS